MPQDKATGRQNIPEFKTNIPKGVNWLLAIAIDEYDAAIGKLNNCVRDVQAFINVVSKRYYFESKHIISLFNANASAEGIEMAFRTLLKEVKPGDNLIIYYSGHGDYDEDIDLGYWVPVDAKSQREGLPNDLITRFLNRIPSRHTLLLCDSCFSGSLLIDEPTKNMGTRYYTQSSRWAITSGSKELVSDGKEHSPFAKALLRILNESTQDVDVVTLGRAIMEEVAANERQKPLFAPMRVQGHQGGMFVFMQKQNEASAWEQTTQLDSIVGYDKFLKDFPNSIRNTEATARLIQLKDISFWEDVNQRNTESAFLEYYEKGADEGKKKKAFIKMQELDDEKSWNIAALRDSIPAYLEYVQKYSKGKYYEDARKKIEEIRLKETQQSEAFGASQFSQELVIKNKSQKNLKSLFVRSPLIVITFVVLVVVIFVTWQFIKYNNTNHNAKLYSENSMDLGFSLSNIDTLSKFIEPKMVFVSGGTFQMGSNDGDEDEKPIRSVTVKDFSIGQYEVTFEEYDLFCEATKRKKPSDEGWGRGKRPVINVSWKDASAYCKWLSLRTRKNYRLPTEAEWEYAARGARKTNNYKFSGSDTIGKVAWYGGNADDSTHLVGTKAPNELGLYDMSGNVWEWVQDCWNPNYKNAPKNGNVWLNGDCSSRVLRGGSWNVVINFCLNANRYQNSSVTTFKDFGFRLAIGT